MDKLWYICAMKYYLAIKRNKVLIHSTTWMNLENIMLRENKATHKGHMLYDSILRNIQDW